MFSKGLTKRIIVLLIVASVMLVPCTTAFATTPTAWAQADVAKADSLGLVPISLASAYQSNITRAEFCALAVRLYEKVNGEITQRGPAFNDTDDVNVRKMANLGIVTGRGGNRFDPDASISRQEAAIILARLSAAVGKPLDDSEPTFADSDQIADWATKDVGKMQASGIMTGSNNAFDPNGAYTREQSIITILRVWNNVNKSESAFIFPYKFTATDLHGNTVTEESLGEKEVFFVHLWATWCPPCVEEMPQLADVVAKYEDRVGFIALLIDYSTDKDVALKLEEATGVNMINVDAYNRDLTVLYAMVESGYVPTTILIDKDGNIIGDQIIGAYGRMYGSFLDAALD